MKQQSAFLTAFVSSLKGHLQHLPPDGDAMLSRLEQTAGLALVSINGLTREFQLVRATGDKTAAAHYGIGDPESAPAVGLVKGLSGRPA